MFHKDNPEYNRRQVGFYTLDELVPKDHFLRKFEYMLHLFLQFILSKKLHFIIHRDKMQIY